MDNHRELLTPCTACPWHGQAVQCLGIKGRCANGSVIETRVGPAAPRSDRRVRVGIWTVGCYLGGAEMVTSAFFDHLDRSRIEWVGVACQQVPNVPTIPTVEAEWSKHCPVEHGLDAMRDLACRVDVLYAWGVMTAAIEQLLAPGYPIVQASHSALDEPWVHQMCGFAGSVSVAVSRAALRGLAPDRRATSPIILNAVSPDRVARTRTRAEQLALWGLPANAKVAGSLNRIADEKRPTVFVDGIALLPEGWYGVMVGAGLAREKTIAYATSVAPGRVIFPEAATGPVGDVLGAFDLHVMTTRSEACSLSAAETWLAGIPLISTPVGLLEDRPELARLLPSDPSGRDVAAAILADEADREGTAARVALARRFAEDELSPERFGREWTDLLCSVARPRAAAPPAARPSIDPAIRDAVNACPHRGSEGGIVLTESERGSCCGGGVERTSCAIGKGAQPGRVTLRECLMCKAG